MFEIREMKVEDLEEVVLIEKENFSRPWTEAGFEKAIEDANTVYLVAVQDGNIIGYIGMWMVLDEGEITNVSVKKEFQGQKAGSKLLAALLEIGNEKGILSYFLEVRKSNESARALYMKMGFEESGVRKNFYEDPVEDGIMMCKR